ncbi:hypothetical protein DFH09DRAFT_1282804 [Mycena vulgaris]|nr:hypothetical protein DFH09DRAFT_1282804 [Mycena vulgaris]
MFGKGSAHQFGPQLRGFLWLAACRPSKTSLAHPIHGKRMLLIQGPYVQFSIQPLPTPDIRRVNDSDERIHVGRRRVTNIVMVLDKRQDTGRGLVTNKMRMAPSKMGARSTGQAFPALEGGNFARNFELGNYASTTNLEDRRDAPHTSVPPSSQSTGVANSHSKAASRLRKARTHNVRIVITNRGEWLWPLLK